MKRVAIVLAVVLAIPVVLIGVPFLLIESGEVIVIRTSPPRGDEFLARLWVVDHEDAPWIGKLDPSEARWVTRVRGESEIQLSRDGVASCRRPVFVEDPKTRESLYALFLEKYAVPLYGARALGFLFGGNPDPSEAAYSAVLIRLEPCAAAPPGVR